MRARAVSLALVATLASLVLQPLQAEPYGSCESGGDAGNTAAAATPAASPVACTGSLSATTDQDWFAFDVPAGAQFIVTAKGAPTDVRVDLFNPAGQTRAYFSCIADTGICREVSAAGGTWKVGVLPRAGATTYALSIVVRRSPSACEPNGDAPTYPSSASSPYPVCIGEITTQDDQDWYHVDVAAVGQPPTIVATLVPLSGGRLRISLKDPNNADRDSDFCTNSDASACVISEAGPGKWKFGVVAESGGSGAYALVLTTTAARIDVEARCEPSTGTMDAGNDPATATALSSMTPGSTQSICSGELGEGDLADWFRFDVYGDSSALQIVLIPQDGAALTLKVTDPDPTTEQDPAVQEENGVSIVSVTPTFEQRATGTWRIGIEPVGEAIGPYTLVVSVESL